MTVEDVRQLMGASTPHFALQLRDRIAKLIAPLDPDDPARVLGEEEIRRLEQLASTVRRAAAGRRTASARSPRWHLTDAGPGSPVNDAPVTAAPPARLARVMIDPLQLSIERRRRRPGEPLPGPYAVGDYAAGCASSCGHSRACS